MVEQNRKPRTFEEVREARLQASGTFHAAHNEGDREVREETRADGVRTEYGTEVVQPGVETEIDTLLGQADARTEALKSFRNAHNGGSGKKGSLRW